MEKPQLINFIAKVMEDSGFKVYKNFKTSQRVIDIYAILPTTIGDFGVVVACKNYDKNFEVGVDVLRDMERVAELAAHFKIPAMVCINKFDLNHTATEAIEEFAAKKNVTTVGRIPFDPVFTKSMVQGQTLFEYDGNSEACLAVKQVWEKVVAALGI